MNKAKLVNNRILIKKKSIHKMIMHFLFILLLLYAAKDVLYSAGSISQSVLLIHLSLSSFYFFKTVFHQRNNVFYKTWTALLLLNVIGFLFTGNINNPTSLGMFLGVLISLLTFYPFYFFAYKGILGSNNLILFLFLMLFISISQYIHNISTIFYESGNTDIVNNVSFMFVNLIPYVFLIKKNRILSFGMMFIIMIFVVQGAKRGAIITGLSGVFLFIYYMFKTTNKKYKKLNYLIIMTVSFLILNYLYNLFTSNEFLLYRFENMFSSGGSGRDIIYKNLINHWYNTDSFFKLMFGFGFSSSVDITGTYAHNDWLELLSNFGIFGVSIYLWLFITGFKLLIKKKCIEDLKYVFLATIIIWFITTLFSMGYTSAEGYMRAVIIAFVIGFTQKDASKTQ